MKKMFEGFYETTDKELKDIWKESSTLFVFDTNVLLNLYSYAEKTRNDFFNLIKKSIISNIWIPYHVGLEYQ
ncbi:PIN-like domain-containing protein [Aliarcobacter cryaerophilus]|uniref:PIN-like domain-containing protein n=1 Tax=Aliarcobacter cryaerophilus TaxID=28198 RepID=UPI003DA264ED